MDPLDGLNPEQRRAAEAVRLLLLGSVGLRYNLMRTDSRVEFKPGGTYIGAQVVALSVGFASAPVLRPGDTLTRVSVIDRIFARTSSRPRGGICPRSCPVSARSAVIFRAPRRT